MNLPKIGTGPTTRFTLGSLRLTPSDQSQADTHAPRRLLQLRIRPITCLHGTTASTTSQYQRPKIPQNQCGVTHQQCISKQTYIRFLSAQYTLSQTQRFYCVTSYMTEKLSKN